jgi:hypothetical protein
MDDGAESGGEAFEGQAGRRRSGLARGDRNFGSDLVHGVAFLGREILRPRLHYYLDNVNRVRSGFSRSEFPQPLESLRHAISPSAREAGLPPMA